MSNVSYDLDTSGGLMPLIRALIKPPDEDVNAQKPKKPQHPYYKRPGKGHNHDSCDACGEGGDLICCDRCPASFHLGCYDPPISETDIPVGLWLCRECRASDAEKPPSARGSRAQSPADKSDNERKTRSRNNRSSSKKRSKDEDETKEPEVPETPVEKELSPMEVLVKAAKIMNPTQFQLPNEMKIPIIFPGTDKEAPAVESRATEAGGVWGAACYACSGSCRVAPLLQCDYCPLLFHQDCLDPPLTALPTGRWMCPNHVEQFIDWKLVNSVSVTERVALWDKFSGPVDQHAIKIDFLKRARNKAPRFRSKLPVAGRARVNVPAMVREHYANPPPLLPSRREHLRCHNVLKRLKADGLYSESESEGEEKHQVCVNPTCPAEENGTCAAKRKETAKEDDDVSMKEEDIKDDTGSSSDSSSSYLPQRARRPRPRPRPAPITVRLSTEAGLERLLATVDDQLRNIDEGLVKIMAWQRLQQVLMGERVGGAYRHSPLSRAAERLVRDAVPRDPHRALPSDLLSRADRERIAASVWGAARAHPLDPPSPSPSPSPGHSLSDAALRAAFIPAKCTSLPCVGMRGACIKIGTGPECELRLSPAHCRRLDRRHAVLFMDEVSRHFELINYSEYGTTVNGVLYACDVELSTPTRPRVANTANVANAVANVPNEGAKTEDVEAKEEALREVVKHRMPKGLSITGDITSPKGDGHPCKCSGTGVGARGAWEGAALVPHGALLQFGCIEYVFSIVDDVEMDPAF